MILTQTFWFRHGLKQFEDDINGLVIKGNYEVREVQVHRGLLGLRYVVIAILDKPLPGMNGRDA